MVRVISDPSREKREGLIDEYRDAVRDATDTQIEQARAQLRVVVDPLEEIFADDDAAAREALFTLLGGARRRAGRCLYLTRRDFSSSARFSSATWLFSPPMIHDGCRSQRMGSCPGTIRLVSFFSRARMRSYV